MVDAWYMRGFGTVTDKYLEKVKFNKVSFLIFMIVLVRIERTGKWQKFTTGTFTTIEYIHSKNVPTMFSTNSIAPIEK